MITAAGVTNQDLQRSSPIADLGSGGFSVDASVRIEGEDRAGIERLVRYCARPPFALERLHALDSAPALASPESRLLYRFPKPDVHGRTELLLTPLELLEALSKFVPPPRVHRHRYHGVLAPNARLQPYVVAFGRPERVSEEPTTEAAAASPGPSPDSASAPASPARIRWAVLQQVVSHSTWFVHHMEPIL